jgi:hypothetical protein
MLIKNNLGIFFLLILLGFGAFNSSTWAQSITPLKLDASKVPWTHLSFHAKNFWVEVSTEIQLRSRRASDLDAVLLAPSKGRPIKPKASQVAEMKISTTITPRFRSPVKIHNRIWFNPTDASPLGRVRLRRGDDDFKKIYRFTKQGVFRHRMEPKNKKEVSLAPEKWTDVKDSFYPYDLARMGCSGVSESSLLIYIVSAAATSVQEDPLSLCVFGKRQLHRVVLQKAGVYPISIGFIEKKQQTETHKEGFVKAIKISLTSEPMESDLKEAENFSFLGFHKDISLYLDPATHFPIKASGIIPTVGKVHLNLREVQTK